MTGRLAAQDITTADSPTSVYRCRTTGYAVVSVNICNRGAGPADITIIVSDTANISDLAGTIEFQTTVNSKDVLERTGIVVGSTQYLTVASSVANVSVVAMGAEVGEFDSDIAAIPIPLIWSLSSTLDNPNAFGTSDGDLFGSSVAVSGDRAIIGAWKEDYTDGTNSGKAYIFNVTTGALVHTLDNPNAYDTEADDSFGYSVAISGDRAIVGAQGEDDAGGTRSAKAYIFNVTTGALVHTLDNPNAFGTSNEDRFGLRVAISGDRAIVGAYDEDDAGGTGSGKAYIFNVTTGALVHTLDNPNAFDTSLGDRFGYRVAISDNYAIVGAYYEDDAGGTGSGKAYIYSVATGSLIHTLDNPNAYDTTLNDNFGGEVAISDNYAIVSSANEDDAGGTSSGKVYIFDVSTGLLVRTLDNPNVFGTSASDRFGYSLAISSGNYAVVGTFSEDDAGGIFSGKAYIYNVSTGSLVATLDNPNAYGTSETDYFAQYVSIDDNSVVVGAPNEDDAGGNNSGKAYIYQLS